MGPFTALGQQRIKVFGRLGRTPIGTDVTGLEAVTDGQQIHTQPCHLEGTNVGEAFGSRQGD